MAVRRRWVAIVLGVGVLLVFAGIAAAIAIAVWFQQNVRIEEQVSPQTVDTAFTEVRQQFAGRAPILEVVDGRPAFVGGQPPPPPASPAPVSDLHVLAWDARDEHLARVAIPFWILRFQSGPVQFGRYASGLDDRGVNLSAADLERYGPGILIDIDTPRGDRVLVWTQ